MNLITNLILFFNFMPFILTFTGQTEEMTSLTVYQFQLQVPQHVYQIKTKPGDLIFAIAECVDGTGKMKISILQQGKFKSFSDEPSTSGSGRRCYTNIKYTAQAQSKIYSKVSPTFLEDEQFSYKFSYKIVRKKQNNSVIQHTYQYYTFFKNGNPYTQFWMSGQQCITEYYINYENAEQLSTHLTFGQNQQNIESKKNSNGDKYFIKDLQQNTEWYFSLKYDTSLSYSTVKNINVIVSKFTSDENKSRRCCRQYGKIFDKKTLSCVQDPNITLTPIPQNNQQKQLPIKTIIIIISSVAGFIVLTLIICLFCRRQKKLAQVHAAKQNNADENDNKNKIIEDKISVQQNNQNFIYSDRSKLTVQSTKSKSNEQMKQTSSFKQLLISQQCIICLDTKCDAICPDCGKQFHQKCLKQWNLKHDICPNCLDKINNNKNLGAKQTA